MFDTYSALYLRWYLLLSSLVQAFHGGMWKGRRSHTAKSRIMQIEIYVHMTKVGLMDEIFVPNINWPGKKNQPFLNILLLPNLP